MTNPANFSLWAQEKGQAYRQLKDRSARAAMEAAGSIIGVFDDDVLYQDSFSPMTIQRYTRKAQGAIYGSPVKIKDGCTPFTNLFIAGTDQGYLGIVGSMLSGVTIVNQQLLQ